MFIRSTGERHRPLLPGRVSHIGPCCSHSPNNQSIFIAWLGKRRYLLHHHMREISALSYVREREIYIHALSLSLTSEIYVLSYEMKYLCYCHIRDLRYLFSLSLYVKHFSFFVLFERSQYVIFSVLSCDIISLL